MPSLEYLTAVISIEFVIAMGVEMSRWPCVLQSRLYILRSDWPNCRQLCRLTTIQLMYDDKLIGHTDFTSEKRVLNNTECVLFKKVVENVKRYGTRYEQYQVFVSTMVIYTC